VRSLLTATTRDATSSARRHATRAYPTDEAWHRRKVTIHMRVRDADREQMGRFGVLATTALVIAGAALGFAMVSTHPSYFVDEAAHTRQVALFVSGKFEIFAGTTMIPTYHAILAAAEWATGYDSIGLLRFVNLLGSLLLPLLIWQLVAMYAPQESGRRTIQWFFMPLLFPFFFLVYTDAWTLAAVLATQLSALRRRYVLAAVTGLAAALLRQDMIVWVGMAWLLVLLEDSDVLAWHREWRSLLRRGFVHGLPLFLVMLSFLSFFLWNHGIAVGDRTRHEVGFNPTNIACFLLCAWFVFLPQNVRAIPRILGLLRRPVCIALLVAGCALYMGTYANTHEYNREGLRFYLHNEALYWLTNYTWIRATAFVPMAWMVLTLCVTDLAESRLRIMYLVAPLSVGLHPLIEPRYYLPALTLFQVWRPTAGGHWENALLASYVVITLWIMWGTISGQFFL
jgi:alpha-1,2-glucosyltransferase